MNSLFANFRRVTIGCAAMATLAFGAGSVMAQVSENRVATNTDWSVFVESDPTECWVVSSPKETVNKKDGRVVAVRRSAILFYVTYRPSAGVVAEVSFTGGYPFAKDSTVNVKVGDTDFEFFTSDENAWPATPGDDKKIVTAMKRGASAVVTGRSARGTVTQDTFSLLGFTASVEEAEKRCVS